MGTTLNASAIDKLLRDRYPEDDEVWPQFNTGTPAMDLLTKGSGLPKYSELDAEGRQLRIPVHTAGNPNAAVPVREAGGYPTTGNQTVNEAVYTINQFVSSFQISGLARRKAPGGAKSVKNALEFEMTQQMKNARQRFNRYLHSDGSAMMAACASVAGNVITLAAGTDLSAVPVGMECQIVHKTTGAMPAGHPAPNAALVISAQATTPSITVLNEDGTIPVLTGIDSNYGVYLFDAQGNGMFGFGIMCSDANPTNWGPGTPYYGNINRTGNDWWKASRLNANGGIVSIQRHIQPILALIDKRIGQKFGGKLLGFTGYDNFYALCNSMARNQRTNYNVRLKRGYEGAQYNNCVFALDYQALASAIRFVSPEATYRYIMDEWYWEDEAGSIMERVTTSTGRPTNVFRLNMLSRQQFISVQCIANAELYGTAGVN